ncbi:MAG: DUF342 domain-containing protein [Spirochaetaceae bacterium]|nr:MAG: DUF342 domain-containing protein [Spirochaetaceae bacterium]
MEQRSGSQDGTFELYYRKGWAYLVVRPPLARGRPVYPEQIENRMKILRIPRVSGRRIREVIEEATAEPVALVEWPEGRRLAARVEVEIAEDEMSAWVTLEAPHKGAGTPTVEDIDDELNQCGVIFGIDRQAVQRLAVQQAYGVRTLVAEGDHPIAGTGNRVYYHFNTNRGKPYLEMDFGRINLKELNFIDNREAGDLLAALLPPIEARDGRTVTGRVIAAERDTRPVELNGGANTRLNPERTELYATCDGNVRISARKVIVEPVVKVKNVNYETGNIRFDGSVVVEGSIADGFVIEASGDIQVGKGVGKATLKAGGNILLKTGINGNGAGQIECDGDLFARYVESCSVTCRGHLLVEEAIMHSHLRVWKHCVLNGRRSEFIAGDIIVGGTLWCKKLGNFNEAPTRVAIGVVPKLLLTYRSTRHELDEKQDQLDQTDAKLEQLEKAIHDGNNDQRVLQAREQLRATAGSLQNEINTLRRRVPQLREQLKASRKSLLVVEDTLFKGVVLTFGKLEYRVPDNGVRKTIFHAGEYEIQESGYDYHNRPELDFEYDEAEDAPRV